MDKLLLFNYNIQNNLTIIIIYRKMKWRWKGTYIEAGEFGHKQIIIINRAGGTYKWMKVGNRAGLGSVCVRRGIGQWVVMRVVVVRAAVVVEAAAMVGSSTWCRRWWSWGCRRRRRCVGGGVSGC